MKYVDEYRDPERARRLAESIRRLVTRPWSIMEICGGQTHSILRFAIDEILPKELTLIHGPGCPVCVIPMGRVDDAIHVASQPGVILACFGDMMRVPGSERSLLDAKAAGADIRMVYSTLDALRIAEQEPGREVVFFAIGFETTTPPTALAIRLADKKRLENFSVFCNHVITPAAIASILDHPDIRTLGAIRIDGFIGPAHVSTVMGTSEYERLAERFRSADCRNRL